MLKFIFLLLLSQFTYAQQSHDEIIQRFIEQRKQMIEEMTKAFDDDAFFSDDFKADQLFDSIQKSGIAGFKSGERNVKVEEKVKDDGSIDVVITPQSENVNLDIETKDNRISIKSEMRVKEKKESDQGSSQVLSHSSFSRSVSIPDGFTASSPKQVDKSIVITLVPNEGQEIKVIEPSGAQDKKVPLKRRNGEKVI